MVEDPLSPFRKDPFNIISIHPKLDVYPSPLARSSLTRLIFLESPPSPPLVPFSLISSFVTSLTPLNNVCTICDLKRDSRYPSLTSWNWFPRCIGTNTQICLSRPTSRSLSDLTLFSPRSIRSILHSLLSARPDLLPPLLQSLYVSNSWVLKNLHYHLTYVSRPSPWQ